MVFRLIILFMVIFRLLRLRLMKFVVPFALTSPLIVRFRVIILPRVNVGRGPWVASGSGRVPFAFRRLILTRRRPMKSFLVLITSWSVLLSQ